MMEWPMSSATINIHSYLLVSRDREVVVGCAYTHELNRMQSMCVGRTTGTVQLCLCLRGRQFNSIIFIYTYLLLLSVLLY